MPECFYRLVPEDELCSNEWKLRDHFREIRFEKDQPILPT